MDPEELLIVVIYIQLNSAFLGLHFYLRSEVFPSFHMTALRAFEDWYCDVLKASLLLPELWFREIHLSRRSNVYDGLEQTERQQNQQDQGEGQCQGPEEKTKPDLPQ